MNRRPTSPRAGAAELQSVRPRKPSTVYLTAINGTSVAERYSYDAYGTMLSTSGGQASPSAAHTPWLFAGDGLYDPGSGWRYNLVRYVNGFWLTGRDPNGGSTADPSTLHKYLYAAADPVMGWDPSGMMTENEQLTVRLISAVLIGMVALSAIKNTMRASISFWNGKNKQGTLFLIKEIQDMVSLGFAGDGGTINPEPLLAASSVVRLAEVSEAAAAQLARSFLAVFAASASGWNYVKRPHMNEKDVPGAQGNPVRVVGQSGSSSQTPGHDPKIDSLVAEEVAKPGRLVVFMQRSLGTITNRAFLSRLIPDVVVVRMEEGQIKIDMYEVQSNGQSLKELQDKVDGLMELLPESMRGDGKVVKP